MHLKERRLENLTELGDVAETYVEAHATDIVFGLDPKIPKFRSAQSTPRRCFHCGQAGHVSFQCTRKAPEARPVGAPRPQGPPYVQQRAGYAQPQVPRTPPRTQGSNQPRSPPRTAGPRCFQCNRFGHIARNCLSKPAAAIELQSREGAFGELQEEVAACQPRGSAPNYSGRNGDACKAHKRVRCPECLDLYDPSHHCQASSMIAFCQDCGIRFPVVADACQSPDKSRRMPVAEGSVEGTPVSVLRDTGCSTIIVRRALVPDDKLTGREARCILIDGTVRYTPVTEIYVETPFFTGITLSLIHI